MIAPMAPGEYGLSLDAEGQYLREVHGTAPLTAEEEAGLLACVLGLEGHGGHRRQGREGRDCDTTVSAARARLIAGYQPLIIGIARRQVGGARVLEFLDLVQEGNVGLLEALARYPQTERQLPFRWWACAAIRRAMRTALARESATYVPLHKAKVIRRVAAEQARLWSALGRRPTEQEMAATLGLPQLAVREALLLAAHSLEGLLGAGEDDHTRSLGGVLAEPLEESASQRGDYVAALVAHLPARERHVITLRYGFGDGRSLSSNEVAALLGLSPARVEELDRQARHRLRKALQFLVLHRGAGSACREGSVVAQTSKLV